jgi:RNA polymerase sigma-70 factor, ECF subfamily
MTTSMAGVSTLAELASAIGIRAEEAAIITELKAGSEEAYAWLIEQFHQPVYGLVYRMVNDPADAADTAQEVFVKVFRGIQRFNGASSLKTWIYRIAVHEASNHRRWWFRHKSRETSIEPAIPGNSAAGLKDTLVDEGVSPFDNIARSELRSRVERELEHVTEPYRTALILRDIEELSYEEVAEVMECNLGTVKSRIVRGREALRKRLERFMEESGRQAETSPGRAISCSPELEVTR